MYEQRIMMLLVQGFHKAVKKHDKMLPLAPCQQFYMHVLRNQPWVQVRTMVLACSHASTFLGSNAWLTLLEARQYLGTADMADQQASVSWPCSCSRAAKWSVKSQQCRQCCRCLTAWWGGVRAGGPQRAAGAAVQRVQPAAGPRVAGHAAAAGIAQRQRARACFARPQLRRI